MPVIDAHAHIYPDKIAAKAAHAIGTFYGVEHMAGAGTVEHLLECAKGTPISHFIVHSVATSTHAVTSINDFIAGQCASHSNFIGFGTMHQDFEDMEAEVARIESLGLRGIKIHPDTQRVNMDDERLMQLYEIIEGRLPIVIHTGDYRYEYSNPTRLLRILKAFPKLTVDAAHFGCWSRFDVGWDVLHKAAENGRVFVDTSSSQFFLGQRHTVELARLWGCEHIMFGSDYPMWDPAAEYEQFVSAGFTDAELEAMLWGNAERFTGVGVQ